MPQVRTIKSSINTSLFGISAGQRLLYALSAVSGLWLLVWWAL
jgi:hypothetical protein